MVRFFIIFDFSVRVFGPWMNSFLARRRFPHPRRQATPFESFPAFTHSFRKFWPALQKKFGKSRSFAADYPPSPTLRRAGQRMSRIGDLQAHACHNRRSFAETFVIFVVLPWGTRDEDPHVYGCFFLAEFLECGIGAQRVPEGIQAKKGGRNGRLLFGRKASRYMAFVTAQSGL
jgi:hypothetical protein